VSRFGELEEAIMDRVWAADGPVRVREVLEGLRRDREIAYTTVQRVMEILRRKGGLDREKDGRAHRYQATAARADYTARLMDEALAESPDRSAALVRFIEGMDAAEVAQLRDALRRARAGESA
jgi:predicted transcriptional regulator